MTKNICKRTVRSFALIMAALICLSAASCKSESGQTDDEVHELQNNGLASGDGSGGSNTEVISSADIAVEYTKTDLNAAYDSPTATVECSGTNASITGSGIALEAGKLTVTAAGCYLLSGDFEGQVLIEAPDTDKVQLVLNGFTVTYAEGSPILCESADKLVITLAEGSVNRVNDTGSGYIDVEDGESDPNTRTGGAIHAKCAMTINGNGSIEVESTYHHGIFTKKTLKIISGTISVDAPGDALKGKNAVAIKDGKITLDAGGDGIQCSEEVNTEHGYIWIEGGDLTLSAEGDGLDASLYLLMKGGNVEVTTTGTERKVYDESESTESGNAGGMTGGMGRPVMGGMMGGGSYVSSDGYEMNSDGYYKITSKGVKSGGLIELTGGSLTVVSTGHAIKADGDLLVGGDAKVEVTARCEAFRANSKGLSADGQLAITGGDVVVHYAYEGIEAGGSIVVSGGSARVLEAVDDGLNVGTIGQNIAVSGGYVFVNAGGDGIDSNGNVQISGGTVLVAGPTNSGNGALDCGDGGYTITVSGGLLIAYGASGMAEAPSTSSEQCSISYNTTLRSGTLFYILDSDGNAVTAVQLLKDAQNIVVSSPALKQGESYTLYSGGTAEGVNSDGLVTGSVSGGSTITELTLSSIVTGSGGGMGNMGGGPGGMGGDPGGMGGGMGGRPW